MSAVSVGTAYLEIIPSARGFMSNLNRQVVGEAAGVGRSIGQDIAKGVTGAIEAGAAGASGAVKRAGKDISAGISGAVAEGGKDAGRSGQKIGKDVAGAATKATAGTGKEITKNLTPAASSMTAKGREIGGKISAGMKSRVGELAKSTFAPLLALGATAGAADFLRDSIDEARESQKVGAQTEAVIKSTGGAAKVSADQIGDLATALSNKTGIDDEAIQSGQNLLLTFTNIKDEAGKGNDIFSQSTSLLVDMATAMGKAPKDAAVQLGKALNDPVKGMTALSKVGVSFTAQQKATNKALVEGGDANALMAMGIISSQADIKIIMKQRKTDFQGAVDYMTKDFDPAQKKLFQHLSEGGHTMEAQKTILAELGKEFGGSAEAQATAGEKLATTWANFKETVGTALIPIIDAMLPKLQTALTWLMDNFPKLSSGIGSVVGWFQKYKDILIPVVAVMGSMLLAWKTYAGVTRVAAAAQAAFNVVMAANPISLVILAIAGLVAGFVLMYQKVGWFRDFVNAAWSGIKTAAQVVVSWFKNTAWPWMQQAFQAIGKAAMSLWQNAIQPAFNFIKAAIVNVVIPYVKILWTVWSTYFKLIWTAVQFAWNNVILPVFNAIKAVITGVVIPVVQWLWAAFQNNFKLIWGIVQLAWSGFLSPIFNAIKSFITGTLGPAVMWLWRNVFQPAFSTIGTIVKGAWDNVISPAFEGIKTGIGKVRDTFDTVVSAISTIWGGLKDVMSGPINAVIGVVNSPFISGLNAILSHIPGVDWRVPSIPTLGGGSSSGSGKLGHQYRADGGTLPGYTPGRDVHQFYSPTAGYLHLSGGEGILRPEVTRAVGSGWLNGANAAARSGGVGGVQRFLGGFADGGVLGWLGNVASGAWDMVKDAGELMYGLATDPVGTMGKAVTSLLGGVGNSFAGQIVLGAGKKIAEGIGNAVSGLFGGGAGGSQDSEGSAAMPSGGLGSIGPLVAFGHRLQAMGFKVAENPYFGGVHPVHMKGSDHYSGHAIDVNWYPAGQEMAKVDAILPLILQAGLGYVWRSAGHFNHLHVMTRHAYKLNDQWHSYLNGGQIPVFDRGGTLAPGVNVVQNNLGRPEPLRNVDDLSGAGDVATAFEDALVRHTRKLGPREFWLFSREGAFDERLTILTSRR